MQEFSLVFRRPSLETDPAKMNELVAKWQQWLGGLIGQGKVVGNPVRLTPQGKVLKAGGVITDGPFVEIKEKLGGFVIIRAADLDEAVTLAHGCPVLGEDGTVEIRPHAPQPSRS